MELKDIIALCNAGFSKSEILAFVQPTPAGQPVVQPTPAGQPVAQPTPAEQPIQLAPAGQPTHVGQPVPVEQSPLLDAINGLTAQIKTMNIAQTEQPKPQTAEDVLASIIMPCK